MRRGVAGGLELGVPGAAPPLQQVLSRPPIVVHPRRSPRGPSRFAIRSSTSRPRYTDRRVHCSSTPVSHHVDRRFAETLGLEVGGLRRWSGCQWREVTMDVAVVDTLSLGGFAARRVPVLIFDFHQLHLGRCPLMAGAGVGTRRCGLADRHRAGALVLSVLDPGTRRRSPCRFTTSGIRTRPWWTTAWATSPTTVRH